MPTHTTEYSNTELDLDMGRESVPYQQLLFDEAQHKITWAALLFLNTTQALETLEFMCGCASFSCYYGYRTDPSVPHNCRSSTTVWITPITVRDTERLPGEDSTRNNPCSYTKTNCLGISTRLDFRRPTLIFRVYKDISCHDSYDHCAATPHRFSMAWFIGHPGAAELLSVQQAKVS